MVAYCRPSPFPPYLPTPYHDANYYASRSQARSQRPGEDAAELFWNYSKILIMVWNTVPARTEGQALLTEQWRLKNL